jgi:hypothetical protein
MIDIIAVTYGQNYQLKCFINSIKAQYNDSWKLFIIHDGPNENLKKDLIDNGYLQKDKIIFIEHPLRTEHYGHVLRDWGLENLATSEYVILTNGDNYYTPNMVSEVLKRSEDLIYFDCVHSHKTPINHNSSDYGFMDTKLQSSRIDMGGAVVRTKIAKKVGFKNKDFAADWKYFKSILDLGITSYKINKILFVHN